MTPEPAKPTHWMITNPAEIELHRMRVIAVALKMYAKTGMKANRAYTPTNMMAAATKFTGIRFKARDYMGAYNAIMEKLP